MGKQFGFLMDKSNEEKFLHYVLESANMYTDEIKHREGRVNELSDEVMNYNWLKIYFSVKEEMDIEYKELPNGGKYINGISESVIEYCRTVVSKNEKSIMRGRLWVEMKYYDDKGELKNKSKELEGLYKDLCKWIRKNLRKVIIEEDGSVRKEYVSESMVGLVEEGYFLHG